MMGHIAKLERGEQDATVETLDAFAQFLSHCLWTATDDVLAFFHLVPVGERSDEASVLTGDLEQRAHAGVPRWKHVFTRHAQEFFREIPKRFFKFFPCLLVGLGHVDKSRPTHLLGAYFVVELFPGISPKGVKVVLDNLQWREGNRHKRVAVLRYPFDGL